ncbi:MAG: hypothetical protein CMC10_04200 [Flavobacteriaceae bacterium]|nr:hypothetical protein [Flavobacteriaceae bacterium]MAQ62399.1 hypothetical protein [Flavobacteriales bacterium]MEC8546834.1 DUF2237 domain-containing protein [Bacteroidota bacterium]MEE2723387.1 DUF2237 domain-containing protein [Bacteroidota bacterium]|tara:strand:- start:46 stop:414 length:369 start_codon:yes stop_codon:yes gene_type:complete
MERNVFGEPLEICCLKPMTGYFRDGSCRTDNEDIGTHTVCAVMTEDFLRFSAQMGNDLSTPIPYYKFPGLKEGDKWCLCVNRWIEAEKAGKAPKLILEATHEKTLEYTKLDLLVKYAFLKND